MHTAEVTEARPDVREMYVIHRVFRRELALIPELVRGARDGDMPRAQTVGEHVRLVLAGLHMHHVGEDNVLWPRLIERAAPSTGLVETMQAQHQRVDDCVQQIEPALAAWLTDASKVRAERLAQAVEDLAALLVAHLDLEEQEVLPLIERYITVAEWASLGEHGRDAMTKRQLPLMFGSILEDADADERTLMLSALPFPIRIVMRTVGARQYRRYVRRTRGH